MYALDTKTMLTSTVNPFESLRKTTFMVVHTDCPRTAANLYLHLLTREVKLWKEDLSRDIIGGALLAF